MARFEFSYIDMADPNNPVPMTFGVHGVSESVAKGIRAGLRKVPSITDVTVERITETRDVVTGNGPS